MRVTMRVVTDTATLVLFDPAELASREDDDCDWWTGDGDLDREEALARLVFIETGADGAFELTVSDEPHASEGWRLLKEAQLSVFSGTLLFGKAECLPGEGPALEKYLSKVTISPGRFKVRCLQAERPAAGGAAAYLCVLEQSRA